MSTLTFERPARRPHRVTRPVVHRRPTPVPVPVVDERERALTLVREALDHTQLMVAISHGAPQRYSDLRALTSPLGYWDPKRRELAEQWAVDGLLDLGIVGLHNQAREVAHEVECARVRFNNGGLLHDWQAAKYWGGVRRMAQVSGLVDLLSHLRRSHDWDHNPGPAPAMPDRPDANRYAVAPGITATADQIVSAVYGYWLYTDDVYDSIAPLATGEIHAFFRRLVHKLWTDTMAEFAIVEHADAPTVDAARDRAIELEVAGLTALLENGDSVTEHAQAGKVLKFPMRIDDRARLRYIEIHLAASFGFDAYDARARRARMDIDGATRWPY